MARNRPVDAALKEQALRFAEEHGAKRASELTGVPAGTIRAWRSRGPAAGASDSSRAMRLPDGSQPAALQIGGTLDELIAMARRMLSTSEKARRAAEEAIKAGKSTGVKDLAIASGVLLDQSGKLEAAASRVELVQVEITRRQGEQLGHILRLFFGALGAAALMERREGRELLEACVVAAREGDVEALTGRAQERLARRVADVSGDELVEEARRVLRDAFRAEFERERRAREVADDGNVLALPAPADDDAIDAEVIDE